MKPQKIAHVDVDMRSWLALNACRLGPDERMCDRCYDEVRERTYEADLHDSDEED